MFFKYSIGNPPALRVEQHHVSFVKQFKYLGQVFSSDGTLNAEISHRVGKANYAFNRLLKKGIWTDKVIRRKTKLTIYTAIVRSILLYGVETWQASVQEVKRLETAQMQFIFRICGYPLWDPGPSFEEVRARYGVPSIQGMVRYHRLRWFGHVLRLEPSDLPWCTLFGRVDGPLLVGRPQRTWINAIVDDLWALSKVLKLRGVLLPWREDSQDRTKWRNLIMTLVDAHN